jgi:hypothetical protein
VFGSTALPFCMIGFGRQQVLFIQRKAVSLLITVSRNCYFGKEARRAVCSPASFGFVTYVVGTVGKTTMTKRRRLDLIAVQWSGRC